MLRTANDSLAIPLLKRLPWWTLNIEFTDRTEEFATWQRFPLVWPQRLIHAGPINGSRRLFVIPVNVCHLGHRESGRVPWYFPHERQVTGVRICALSCRPEVGVIAWSAAKTNAPRRFWNYPTFNERNYQMIPILVYARWIVIRKYVGSFVCCSLR